jgi:uncharacterized sodium:solute symporter family permease YidK
MSTVTTTSPSGSRAAARRWLNMGGRQNTVVTNAMLVLGAVLIALSALIHYHLWSTGYRNIPTIGPLFLLQVIAGFVLAATLAILRRIWTAVVCFGFVVSTVAGFLLSVSVGLFGFQDSWSAPWAKGAFALEVAAAVVLAVGGALCALRPAPEGRFGPPTAPPSG